MSDSGEHSCMLLGEVTSAGTADESSSEYHASISVASETVGSSSSPFAANPPAANVKRKRTKSKPLHFTPELEEDILGGGGQILFSTIKVITDLATEIKNLK